MKIGKIWNLLIGVWAMLLTPLSYAVDFQFIERELAGAGLEGNIHGAVPERALFVLAYRDPQDFFDSVELVLVPSSEALATQLGTLKRHDRVRVRGRFLQNPSPQKHILVSGLDLIASQNEPYPVEPYPRTAELPEELLTANSALFLVHAVAGGGRVLVLEYEDKIVPVYLRTATLPSDLSRNDVVRIRYRVRSEPERPTHLELDESSANALEVIESVSARHGQAADVTGALVLFPQAPGIRFNVFAVQDEAWPGLLRQFTIINFSDAELFRQLREKLQAAWDQAPNSYHNGRNKLVSDCLRVRARGVFNQVDPGQANTQILVSDLAAIEVQNICPVP